MDHDIGGEDGVENDGSGERVADITLILENCNDDDDDEVEQKDDKKRYNIDVVVSGGSCFDEIMRTLEAANNHSL